MRFSLFCWSAAVCLALVAGVLQAVSLPSTLPSARAATAVSVAVPRLLYGNGAALSWSRYQPSAEAPFAGYEVHRGTSAAFSPSAATLVTRIGDIATTAFTDDSAPTAAAGSTIYWYRVVAGGAASTPVEAALPPRGRGRLLVRMDASDAATYLTYGQGGSPCGTDYTMGGYGTLDLGVGPNHYVNRSLLKLDLAAVPAKAKVTWATLDMYYPATTSTDSGVRLHRVLQPWVEGTGASSCGGAASGASWGEAQPGVAWRKSGAPVLGGAFDATAAVTLPVKSRSTAGSDRFQLLSLIQSWVDGTPNHGFLLKQATEPTTYTAPGSRMSYYSDQSTLADKRPFLQLEWEEPSRVAVTTARVTSPADGSVVRGKTWLTADASSPRGVKKVRFSVGGTTVGEDESAPYAVEWDSTAGAAGSQVVTATAVSSADEAVTSAGRSVRVDNSPPPTGVAVTTPSASSTVRGTVAVTASATDDVSVSRVDFMVDGVLVGSDAAAPYSFAWNTTAPLSQAFDGEHKLTVVATDSGGQTTTSAEVAVTVDNNTAGPYKASFSLNGYGASTEPFELPPMIDTDSVEETTSSGTGDIGGGTGIGGKGDLAAPPSCDVSCTSPAAVAGSDAEATAVVAGDPVSPHAFQLDVAVRNDSSVAWKNSTTGTGLQLWYRWYTEDGVVVFEGPGSDYFPATLNPGATKTIPMTIEPPPGVNAAQRTRLRLRMDVYDSATGRWFAQGGSKPVDNPVIVNKALSKQLGFERFWHYEQLALGTGASAYGNVANGNLLWRWSPWATPGRGIASLVDLSYNSLEEHSDSPAGNNVSLNISGLVRFGSRLDIHPNKADQLNGKAKRYVRFVDGDGTLHEFTGTVNADSTVTWTEPAGVNLYLRSTGSTDPKRYWALTRPDRSTYYFDADGYPRLVEDTNGNVLEFELVDTPSGDDPGGPKKRVVKIWDAARRSYAVDYWDKGEAKPGRIRGKVQTISDHSGSVLAFDYYNDGNLRRLTQKGGVSGQGVAVADRSFVFTYTDSNGDQPAIPLAADRVDPNPATNNQSVKVYSIRDPRDKESTFSYWGPTPDPKNRWKLKSWTDRAGKATAFTYDWQSRITTVNAPAARDTDYHLDTAGRVTSLIDPAERTTSLVWSTDNKVTQVTHPSTRTEKFTYDHNGYLTSDTNEAGETSRLTYEHRKLDVRDTVGHWSVLKTRELPEGVASATAGDHTWTFGADADGNITSVKDPDGFASTYAYNLRGSPDAGTVKTRTRPGGGVTGYEYHPSGLPTKVTDPVGNVTSYGYDTDSQVVAVQDGEHQSPRAGLQPRAYQQTFDLDEFGRVARHSQPKSTTTEENRLVWSTTTFDAGDNATATTVPAYAGIEGPPDAARTVQSYDPMDRPVLSTSPDTSVDPAGERTATTYDDAGRPITQVSAKGVRSATDGDYQSVTSYDVLDRIVRVAAYGASATDVRYSHQCYNAADDVVSSTAPRAGLATIDCAATMTPHTTRYTYDNAHRVTVVTDPAGRQQRSTYDKNGRTTTAEKDIDANATPKRVQRTELTYNGRGLATQTVETFSGATGRKLTSRYGYDADGNTVAVYSPRAVDTDANAGLSTDPATAKYTTRHDYDPAGRRLKTTLPYDDRDGTERQYVHAAYDKNSRVTWTSLPTTNADPAHVTDAAKTQQSYFDPGWIRTLGKNVNPVLHFDHNALGLQTIRTPAKRSAPGELDVAQQMRWDYFVDGQKKSMTDRDGNSATWTYDEHNQVTGSYDPTGVHGADDKAVDAQATYTGFGEVAKSRHRKQGATAWTFSSFTYNEHGLPTTRLENGEEDTAGTQTKAPKRVRLSYDSADQLVEQIDDGTSLTACKGDTRTISTYWDNGWERTRDQWRAATGCSVDVTSWKKRQTTSWTHFDNGKLASMSTKNGAGAVTESHDLGYFEGTRYEDGHRVTDTFVLKRAADRATATNCIPGSPCTADYDYDARGKVLRHQKQAGKVATYALDQPTQLIGDTSIRAGNVTTETNNAVTTTRRYEANQLKESSATGTETLKTWYDSLGNTDCVTTSTGDASKCNGPKNRPDASVRAEYTYDPLERLLAQATYASTGGAPTDSSEYIYDAVDRLIEQTEDHAGTTHDRKTAFSHLGLSNQPTREVQTGGTDPRTKTYAYNAVGQRTSMTDQATGSLDDTQTSYTYGTDVHGSVTQLLDENGGIKASYGYDAYGRQDTKDTDTTGLSSGDLEDLKPFNPYRYAGKRLDSGTAGTGRDATTLDMGARRYSLDTTRFLQQDMYSDALGDLGLSLDPLSQNRYALAGGNPVSNVEIDGHINMAEGGGGGTTSGGTTTTSTSTETTSESSGGGGDDDGGTLNKVGDWFKGGADKVDSALDQLDAKTVENPDWKLQGLYESWKKLEEKAEPLTGATDIHTCGTEGGLQNCGWAAAAIVPGGKALKGTKALRGRTRSTKVNGSCSVRPESVRASPRRGTFRSCEDDTSRTWQMTCRVAGCHPVCSISRHGAKVASWCRRTTAAWPH